MKLINVYGHVRAYISEEPNSGWLFKLIEDTNLIIDTMILLILHLSYKLMISFKLPLQVLDSEIGGFQTLNLN